MRKTFPWLLLVALLSCAGLGITQEKITIEDLITRHRNAIGPDPARAAAKTRVAEGTTNYKVISGGSTYFEGKAALISENEKIRVLLRFTSPDYAGENYVTDGERVQVFNKPRSVLSDLVYTQEPIMRDGLLGGVLTTAWPLLSPKMRQAKLSYDGLKKIDGRDLHEVRYTPKKKSEVEVRLYFDPESYRHVLTVYTLSLSARLVGGSSEHDMPISGSGSGGREVNDTNPSHFPRSAETANSKQQVSRYRLEERFDDFRAVDGETLPGTWTLHLTVEGYRSAVINWDIKFDNLTNNLTLDPRNFPMK